MRKTFAFFDFDGTMAPGDSIIGFVTYAFRTRRCSLAHYLLSVWAGFMWLLGAYDEEKSKTMCLRFLKMHSPEEITLLVKEFCQKVLLPKVYPDALTEIKKRHEAGDIVVMVSASTTFYLKELVASLPVDILIGTEYDFEHGRIAGKNCKGEAKAEAIQKMLRERKWKLDTEHSSGYGDSQSDAPMLRLCRRKYGVNAKKALKKQFENDPDFHLLTWR